MRDLHLGGHLLVKGSFPLTGEDRHTGSVSEPQFSTLKPSSPSQVGTQVHLPDGNSKQLKPHSLICTDSRKWLQSDGYPEPALTV